MTSSADPVRVVGLKEVLEWGWDGERLVNELIKLDYETIDGLTQQHAGSTRQWVPVLVYHPDTWRLLVTGPGEIIGNWQFVALFDEDYQRACRGELLEADITSDRVQSVEVPGRYKIYVVALFLRLTYRTAPNLRLLLNSFFENLLELAKQGVFAEEICVNAYTDEAVSLCRTLGFTFQTNHADHGRIFTASMFPFPGGRMFSQHSFLREIYEREFTAQTANDATPVMGVGSQTNAAPVANDSTMFPGSLVDGRFKVVQRLGAGGMGAVHEVEDLLTRDIVAMKVLLPNLWRNSEFAARFVREVSLAMKVTHPNVCRVYDIGNDGSYYTMKLLRGDSLRDLITSAGLELATARTILDDVAAALDAVHDEGIVHRDLKPENIMITRLRGRLTALLTDFGIARTAEIPADKLTKTGEMIGTLHYMAPEQLRGEPPSRRSDVWALGVVMYEALAGTRPFEHRFVGRLVNLIQYEDPVDLAQRRPDIPAPSTAAVMRCLSKRPGDRFERASEVARAFAQPAAER